MSHLGDLSFTPSKGLNHALSNPRDCSPASYLILRRLFRAPTPRCQIRTMMYGHLLNLCSFLLVIIDRLVFIYQGRTRRGPQEEGVFHEALESYHEFMIGSWNDYIGVGTKITVWAPVSE
jgi:hypothetical protein